MLRHPTLRGDQTLRDRNLGTGWPAPSFNRLHPIKASSHKGLIPFCENHSRSNKLPLPHVCIATRRVAGK